DGSLPYTPCLTLVKVQTTASPGATLMVATPWPASPVESVSSQAIDVSSQPATGASATVKAPGSTAKVRRSGRALTLLPSSSRRKAAPPLRPALGVNVKSWAEFGLASLTIVIVARRTLVIRQVTSSPIPTGIPDRSVPDPVRTTTSDEPALVVTTCVQEMPEA